MKVFTIAQIRKADAYTIANEPIQSIDLMERASENCFNWIIKNIDYRNKPFVFFCGLGNNGGDGLAIARMLTEKKLDISTFIINHSLKKSNDFIINEKRLLNAKNVKVYYINDGDELPKINENAIVVDALLGSGLTKPTDGFLAEVIKNINASRAFTIAIDIPSGLFGDNNTNNSGAIIKANVTLSLQFPKLSFFFPSHGHYAGNWVIIPIGLHEAFINNEATPFHFTLLNDVKPYLKKRKKFAHKGLFGHALLVAGSYGKIGAAMMASKACMRTGAGLLTTHVPQCGYGIMQMAVPEAMTIADKNEKYITENYFSDKFTAVAIGPGIDKNDETVKVIHQMLTSCNKPLVIDADAINILAENEKFKKIIPSGSIITPHIKEFERFAGEHFEDDYKRFERQKELSVTYNIIIVLKGAYTCITAPDGNVYFNSTGNPGMATGGSGDVLTGIILGLLSQGYLPIEAAKIGVFLHGLAGDLAADALSEYSLIASDIIKYIPNAYKVLE